MLTSRHGNVIEERNGLFIACTWGAVNVVTSDAHDAELLAVCRNLDEAIHWIDSRADAACPECGGTDVEAVSTFDGPAFECCNCGHGFQTTTH